MIRPADLARLRHIAAVLVRQGAAAAGARLLARWPRLAARWGLAPISGPRRLRITFEELGGTFLKLGQMLALQPDILSLAYCDELFNLLDRVAPFGFAEVDAILREELGGRAEELFDRFDPQPLATASIGQVHAAWLGGRKLAVKVQRPAVEREFRGDIRLLRAVIRMIRLLHVRPLHWLIEPLSEFAAWTREELDYRYEARYMERLRANARGSATERVPALVGSRSSRRVLTVEFLEGVTVLEYLRALDAGDEVLLARVRSSSFEADTFARNAIDNFLGDAFQHGMFHADLHPANLMILPGSVVGYIDFGITAVLSAYSRRHLVALTFAYTRGDLDGMCTAFFKVSVLGIRSDPRGFREGLSELALSWYEEVDGEVRLRKNFTLMMLDMLVLSRATGIFPERDVVKYIRSSIAIDGLITRFAPGFDVGLYLQTVCDRLLRTEAQRSLLTFERLAGWSSAGGRLLTDGPVRAAGFLRRLASGDLPVEAEVGYPAGRRSTLRQQAVQLAAVLLVLAALVAATGGALRFGINLPTAEVLLATAALGMLVKTVRQLT